MQQNPVLERGWVFRNQIVSISTKTRIIVESGCHGQYRQFVASIIGCAPLVAGILLAGFLPLKRGIAMGAIGKIFPFKNT